MSKNQLSKSVMSMRFMQKKDNLQKIDLSENQEVKSPSNITLTQSSSSEFKCIRDKTPDIYSTLPGRRSFGGCNKTVEKYYKELVDEKYMTYKSYKHEKKNDTLDDEEFALRQKELLNKNNNNNKRKLDDIENNKKLDKNIIQVSSKKIKKGKFVV